MQKLLDYVAGVVGFSLGGIFVVVYIGIGLAFYAGGALFLWWLSNLAYDAGIWPIGALLRVIVFIMAAGLVFGIIGAVLGGGMAGLGALGSKLRRKPRI